MPYIKQQDREKFRHSLFNFPKIDNAGELNFIVTSLIKQYVYDKGESYQAYNDILGALEGAKLELYRREVGAYEDIKIKTNGDL